MVENDGGTMTDFTPREMLDAIHQGMLDMARKFSKAPEGTEDYSQVNNGMIKTDGRFRSFDVLPTVSVEE